MTDMSYSVDGMKGASELLLPAVAWVPDLLGRNSQIDEGSLSVPSDCNEGLRPQDFQQPGKHRSSGLTLGAIVATIGHRVVRFVRMKWKYVPQKYGPIDDLKSVPNDRGGALYYHRPNRWSRKGRGSEQSAMSIEMGVIGHRQACAATASVPEITRNPDRIHTSLDRRGKHEREIVSTNFRSVRPIKVRACLGIRVENVLKAQRCQSVEKQFYVRMYGRHANQAVPCGYPSESRKSSSRKWAYRCSLRHTRKLDRPGANVRTE